LRTRSRACGQHCKQQSPIHARTIPRLRWHEQCSAR
jgi:hypothetical protein